MSEARRYRDAARSGRSNKGSWKRSFQGEWEVGNAREDAVANLLRSYGLTVNYVGFGAGSNKLIKGKSTTKGFPDLFLPESQTYVEVTGTKHLQGNGFWVRPDKLAFCHENPSFDVWIAYVLGEKDYQFVFLQFDLTKKYQPAKFLTKRGVETFIVIWPEDPEIKTLENFLTHVRANLRQ